MAWLSCFTRYKAFDISDNDIDLSRSLKVKGDSVIGLPI